MLPLARPAMRTERKIMSKNIDVELKKYYNSLNLPPKPVFCSDKPSKVQESLFDAKSP